MTNKENLIYLAGLMDGEGCICCINPSAEPNKCKLVLEIAITHQPTLQWVKLLFGGNVYKNVRSPRQNNLWRWRLNAVEAVALLKEIIPYLKIKKEEAIEAVKYEKTFNNSPTRRWQRIPQWALDMRKEIYHNLKKLKGRE